MFRNKKKPELERIERQRAESELEARRNQAYQDELHRQEIERQRRTLREQLRAQKELELRMARERDEASRREAEAERRKAEARQRENERLFKEAEKKRMKLDCQAAERKKDEEKISRLEQASPETLRDLRELIRDRFERDVKIWSRRGARRPDRPIIQTNMDRADAIMEEILIMIDMWGDNSDGRWDEEDWEKVQIIRTKLYPIAHGQIKHNLEYWSSGTSAVCVYIGLYVTKIDGS
ncbi:hypothetical protein EK21DRAFT_107935 [Setomelanomma holmii]|uniref:Uncharacterized protein n=1 Tax=Setomelanomma holmii TaxID=210430 RepID=A0A9P4HJU5_9PLEO|nr:hypothetical protein EK21DRAFT_107935 [Setomelanomma holmii]